MKTSNSPTPDIQSFITVTNFSPGEQFRGRKNVLGTQSKEEQEKRRSRSHRRNADASQRTSTSRGGCCKEQCSRARRRPAEMVEVCSGKLVLAKIGHSFWGSIQNASVV